MNDLPWLLVHGTQAWIGALIAAAIIAVVMTLLAPKRRSANLRRGFEADMRPLTSDEATLGDGLVSSVVGVVVAGGKPSPTFDGSQTAATTIRTADANPFLTAANDSTA